MSQRARRSLKTKVGPFHRCHHLPCRDSRVEGGGVREVQESIRQKEGEKGGGGKKNALLPLEPSAVTS